MTLLEAGFNFNHQKSLLRLLRNHGALAALPLHRKVALARFFMGPQLRVGGGAFGSVAFDSVAFGSLAFGSVAFGSVAASQMQQKCSKSVCG